MQQRWLETTVAEDETHHLLDNKPFYEQRFLKVLKYHAPGLAPVLDAEGAYHINETGMAAYQARYRQTFGYYDGYAAVESAEGWFHIDSLGRPIYSTRHAWCGNFQEEFCPVKDDTYGYYYHINMHGQRYYATDYRYVGDYRDGLAVVCREDGLQTHIDRQGNYTHGKWFLGLDVFHKSVARAQDEQGWFHINKKGQPLYAERYKAIEPYYNNIAVVEDFAGSLLTIDLKGKPITTIRTASHNYLHELSAELVGFWKTQTIAAAVKLAIVEYLPADTAYLAAKLYLNPAICLRFLRALQELNLVTLKENNQWHLTPKGSLLSPTRTSPMAAAALIWSDSHYLTWRELMPRLQNTGVNTQDYFEQLAQHQETMQVYQQALAGYAAHDYQKILTAVDWGKHQTVIDAGGGTGALVHLLLEHNQHLQGILLEKPTVIELISAQQRKPNCRYVGVDFRERWPCQADAIILARVLHDWPDHAALSLLQQAKASLNTGGSIYVLEMILLEQAANGGLLDLNMLVMTGGQERTLSQWNNLATAANLTIERTMPFTPIVSLVEMKANDD